MPETQRRYIAELTEAAHADARVHALWLQGSFATERADRYSDVDAHLLTSEADGEQFREAAVSWLDGVRALVYSRTMFGGQMLHTVTDEGMRVDLWMHAGDAHDTGGAATLVLLDEDSRLVAGKTDRSGPGPHASRAAVERHLNEFWRVFAMLPVVVGRAERVKGVLGTALLADTLGEALLHGGSRVRDAGVKRLNEFLPDAWREGIEDALLHSGSSRTAIAETHLRLATLMRAHGRDVAGRHDAEYPAAFEATAVTYVRTELARLAVVVRPELWQPLSNPGTYWVGS